MYYHINPTELFRERQLALLQEAGDRRLARQLRATRAPKVTSTIVAAIGFLAALVVASLLLVSAARPAEAAFPGANGKIIFESTRDGNNEIYAMDPFPEGATTNVPQRLTFNAATDVTPAVSPDGKKIAYECSSGGDSEICVMNSDGTGTPTQLTASTGQNDAPDFSPDGKKIVFESTRNGNFEIYKMNADGSSQKRLTRNRLLDSDPAFSPDGKKIVFMRFRDGNDELYKMNAKDGSSQRKLTNNPGNETLPDWGVAPQ